MEIYLYKKGGRTKLDNSSLNLVEIGIALNSMIKNSDEFMRLYMDEDRFESLKKDEFVAEIILNEEMKINSIQLGELKFKKVLIPLTGDFVGNAQSPSVTLFIGDDKYFPEPISNKTGFLDLQKFKTELEKTNK